MKKIILGSFFQLKVIEENKNNDNKESENKIEEGKVKEENKNKINDGILGQRYQSGRSIRF